MENEQKIPTIAIVGRPNVGKSSLFNCIVGRRLSIVHEMSGVTRDRVVAPVWKGKKFFQLIDTGGLGLFEGEKDQAGGWDSLITEQVASAIEEADVLIMVGNVQDGIVPLDKSAADIIRKVGKPIIFAANKADNASLIENAVEFSTLGFKDLYPVSCLHRNGINAMLDKALSLLPKYQNVSEEEDAIKPINIAVVGRPNVGKSSLVNALLGGERVMVSDVAGTTRDAIDVKFEIKCQDISRPAVFVDTAGIRKGAKVDDIVEYFSVMRSKSAIERADLVLFVLEASPNGVTSQDKRIGSMIQKAGKPCLIVANKFDLQRDGHKVKTLAEELRYTLTGMAYAPVVFISAKERTNLDGMLNCMVELMEQMDMKISTGLLNRVLSEAMLRKTPPVVGPAPLKLYYASQVSMTPPTFLMFVNNPKYCAPNYLSYLKNTLRAAFGFNGMPIEIKMKERPKKVASFHTPSRTPRRPRKK